MGPFIPKSEQQVRQSMLSKCVCVFAYVPPSLLIKNVAFEPYEPICISQWAISLSKDYSSLFLYFISAITPMLPSLSTLWITLFELKPSFISFSATEHRSDNHLIKSLSWSGDQRTEGWEWTAQWGCWLALTSLDFTFLFIGLKFFFTFARLH